MSSTRSTGLTREGERAPKMMSVGLHLRMIGRPGRIGALEAILRHVDAGGDGLDRAARRGRPSLACGFPEKPR